MEEEPEVDELVPDVAEEHAAADLEATEDPEKPEPSLSIVEQAPEASDPGIDPNENEIEINVRQAVFYPDSL